MYVIGFIARLVARAKKRATCARIRRSRRQSRSMTSCSTSCSASSSVAGSATRCSTAGQSWFPTRCTSSRSPKAACRSTAGWPGVLFAMWLFGRKHKHTMWRMTDFVAPFVPIGLGCRPHRQFHQRRAVGQADGPAVGIQQVNGVGAAPVAALRGACSRGWCCS